VTNGPTPPTPRDPQLVAIGPQLLVRGKVLPSFAQFAMTGEDALAVTMYSPTVLSAQVLMRFLDAQTQQILPTVVNVACAAGFTPCTTVIPLGIGYILNVTIRVDPEYANQGIQIGDIFIICNLVRGIAPDFQVVGTILQGYITTTQVQGFPGSALLTSLEPLGSVQTFPATTPAAGQEWKFTVPTGVRYRLRSIAAFLTAVAGAFTRNITLSVADASARGLLNSPIPTSITAGGTFTFSWFGNASLKNDAAQTYNAPIPEALWLRPGFQMQSYTFGIQPGDQWQAIMVEVERVVEAT
jgi:hypothetical protein